MDFDDAKENIQPLATGRNATILQASITHSPQELLDQRRELEAGIRAYSGDDPLEPWYNYISWIEQSFPSGGKESGLMQVLSKCLRRFESEEQYYQDRRMIKLFIKFLDSHKDSTECYQQLYNAGIGTMVSDFYIAWAYCYDSVGQMSKADEVFRRGIECRAQPLDELKEAHQHFVLSLAQRTMYKDDEDALLSTNRQIEERRSALSSLRGYRGRTGKSEIGSIRTGVAIKSLQPGTIPHDSVPGSSSSSNAQVAVLADENMNPNMNVDIDEPAVDETEQSIEFQSATVVRSIVDKARNQENEKEPGPWNKVHDKKNAKKLIRQKKVLHTLGFNIHEDKDDKDENCEEISDEFNQIVIAETELNYSKPFKYPVNFAIKNRLQPEWILPVTTECQPESHTLPCYNKCMIYPRPNREFQSEELRAYFYFKKRGVQNAFTQRYNSVWGNDITVPMRLYPNFARESKPQLKNELDSFFAPTTEKGVYMVPLQKLYNVEKQEEFQNEELMQWQLRSGGNITVMAIEDMDETVCTSSNNEQVQRRKSFFPMRRSLAIRSVITSKAEGNSTVTNEFQTTLAQAAETKICTETKKESTVLPTHFGIKTQKDKPEDLANLNEASGVERESMLPTNNKSSFSDFQFKTPALPTKPANQSPEVLEVETQNKIQSLNKLPFEIYEEENTEKVDHGIFDAEETCSTQQFNNFIKSQFVSTPKATQKLQKRQFGVLLDVAVPTPNLVPSGITSDTEATTETEDLVTAVSEPISNSLSSPDVQVDLATNSYSPLQRKQLSTILETSEHVTQSTKSTNGSRESDYADAAINSAANTVLPLTVKETSCQSIKDVVEIMKGVHLTVSTEEECANVSPTQAENNKKPSKLASPVVTKTFSVYQDDAENLPQLPKDTLGKVAAGRFDRMVEREDTGTGFFATYSSLRFQDDKTETLTKIVGPCAFPDDRTETIPKVHDSMLTYEQQPAPTTVPTISLNLLETETETTQQLAKTLNSPKKTQNIPSLPNETAQNLQNLVYDEEDSFEFFRKSPPKAQKMGFKLNFYHLPGEMNESEATPLKTASDAKRFCIQQTPKEILKKSSHCIDKNNTPMDLMKFFENDMMNIDNDKNSEKNTVESEKYANELFPKGESIPENSSFNKIKSAKVLMRNSQADEARSELNATKHVKIVENNLKNDSLLAELMPTNKTAQQSLTRSDISGSFIQNTQQTNTEKVFKPQQKANDKTCSANKSGFLVNMNESKKNLQTTAQKSISTLKDSFLPELSFIEETQPANETSVKSQQKTTSIMTTFEKLCPQAQEKRASSSHIPKRVSTKKTLMESTTTTPLQHIDTQKSNITSNIPTDLSFIPETQEFPSQSNNSFSTQKQTKSFSGSTLIPKSSKKNDSYSSSTSKEASQHTIISKQANLHNTEKHEKSKVDYENSSTSNSNRAPIFELNAETEMFSTGISMIKNSTMLSQTSLKPSPVSTPSKEKLERMDKSSNLITNTNNKSQIPHEETRSLTLLHTEQDRSIYFQNTPRTPVLKIHNISWSSAEEEHGTENSYIRHEVDLNETNQRIYSICEDQHVNPFNADLLNALLDQIDFVSYLNDFKNTMLVGRVTRLSVNSEFTIGNMEFCVSKLIGEGAYGTIYCGVENKSGKQYAFKQERPPNYWEYYICLEVQSRITNEEILSAYMNIDYALIGNNASILISAFSPYGSIISVCNKIKKQTLKNVDEYVVMHLTCELLEIIDHLHSTYIIHADVKADNFLLMKKLTYNSRQLSLQLIDFGVSIDMKHFKKNQTFTYVHNDNAFKCVEMRENRPWTYQLDLYGLAGIIHVMLFGKYMDIEKRADKGIWLPKTHMPRYINKLLWESIFRTLLNVRDCRSMPDLQQLRSMIKEEMAEKETYVINKIAEFNRALNE